VVVILCSGHGRQRSWWGRCRVLASEAARWRAEAQRLATDNLVLQTRVAELEGQVGALAEKVSVLARMAFGTSSEKKPARRAPGDDDTAGASCGDGSAGGPPKRGRGQRKGSRGHGRRDYSHLPTREEVHDVTPGERVCPCCGAGYVPFGEETREQIDWQVQLIRIVHRGPTYRAPADARSAGSWSPHRWARRSARAGSPRDSWPGC
jgi:transposase